MSDTTISSQSSPASTTNVASGAFPQAAGTPRRFHWGVATAAYQIEGSPQADGAGICVWDEFSRTQGNTYEGHTGDVACDHFNRWPQDIALMGELGVSAYRFSIRWPRILPDGDGAVNQPGVDFYDRLVDGLLEAGIEPFVTLFHWDLPAALQRRGGWSNPDVADWFARYAEVLVAALGDRVRNWITLNEPHIVAEHGHLNGDHAPGIRNVYAACHTIHNEIRAHVAAAQVIRSAVPEAAVGLALSNSAITPASADPDDVLAARVARQWHNFPLYLEPLIHGRYPAEIEQRIRPYLPDGYESQLPAMVDAPDFVGINYYSGFLARADASSWLGYSAASEPEIPRTGMGWPIRPEGIHQVLTEVHADYALPAVYVTENGAAFDDLERAGAVEDQQRIDYLDAHIRQVLRARQEGVPVDGYFVWSLLDNYEWAFGYDKRFGIVRVDFETQERIVKNSGWWYRDLIRSQRG